MQGFELKLLCHWKEYCRYLVVLIFDREKRKVGLAEVKVCNGFIVDIFNFTYYLISYLLRKV
jgi:hypothetical protein